jgi:hypothetical protein
MSRLSAVKPALFAALGAVILLVSPATARAANTTPSIVHPSNAQVSYVGTFPDTQAGLNTCATVGIGLIEKPGSKIYDYQCLENNPDPGWNLWVTWSNNYCNTCVKKT